MVLCFRSIFSSLYLWLFDVKVDSPMYQRSDLCFTRPIVLHKFVSLAYIILYQCLRYQCWSINAGCQEGNIKHEHREPRSILDWRHPFYLYIHQQTKALFRSTDSSILEHFGPKTLQTWDTSDQGHFSTCAKMSVRHLSVRHFGTGAKVSGDFRSSLWKTVLNLRIRINKRKMLDLCVSQ